MIEHVAFVTGTRAEYGLLRPIIDAARATPVRVSLVVTGAHLSSAHGQTVREIEADGIPIAARVPILGVDDGPAETARSIGRGVIGCTDAFETLDPDLVLLLGDRSETLAAAIAAVATNRWLAHVHGGDRTRGGLDESYRHAITKLAHVHFAATTRSAERLVRMGEDPGSVHVVGAPGLDAIRTLERWGGSEIERRLGFPLPDRFALLIQHSISIDPDAADQQMRATLDALARTGLPVIASAPNSDPGGRRVRAVLEAATRGSRLRLFDNLDHALFLNLLARATVLVGNSSCGIIEAASFGVPVVDIGERQAGRERAGNVITVDHEEGAIAAALDRALHDEEFRRVARTVVNPYGDGRAAPRIVEQIARLSGETLTRQKQIAY
ncbi:MAG: UDP-N-acetylglucosamine 2-epimerase (hydrolyzing) [Planctomycetes bacterium]|nr:UDP-N-acetylglucosamine 2-epimerase (hydrolyzing) [Planctomycetota bacterium]